MKEFSPLFPPGENKNKKEINKKLGERKIMRKDKNEKEIKCKSVLPSFREE